MRQTEENPANFDPVFLKYGMKVYSQEYIKKLREENLELKIKGKRITNLVPQEGFQERVCLADADLVICGGRRGAGKSFISLFKALPYMFNPDVSMYAFRRLEDDVKRGPWKLCKQVYRGFGSPKEASFEFSFLDGHGATMKMEHLQDLGKVSVIPWC